jgi:D-glycero-alpha-D-manno-heptose 1-phosphate guanylyltransferase
MEAIVLAGGQGTRLQSVLPHQQKCMAPVLGKPFLSHVMAQLSKQGFNRFILATGHHQTQVAEWVHQQPNAHEMVLSVEEHPLGTGGALIQALRQAKEELVLVVNGDSYISFDYPSLLSIHLNNKAAMSLVCTPIDDALRYGSLELDESGCITRWKEKGNPGPALVNAGVYLLSTAAFIKDTVAPCSLEKEIIPTLIQQQKVYALQTPGPLLDIGTPESLAQAAAFIRTELPSP